MLSATSSLVSQPEISSTRCSCLCVWQLDNSDNRFPLFQFCLPFSLYPRTSSFRVRLGGHSTLISLPESAAEMIYSTSYLPSFHGRFLSMSRPQTGSTRGRFISASRSCHCIYLPVILQDRQVNWLIWPTVEGNEQVGDSSRTVTLLLCYYITDRLVLGHSIIYLSDIMHFFDTPATVLW